MRRLARRRPLLLAVIVVALIVVVLFGGRAALRLAWRLAGPPPPPRQTDVELIADWMSVPYIGRAYRVPSSELFAALGVKPEGRRTHSLRDIATEASITSAQAVEEVQRAVRAWQETHPDRARPGVEKPADAPDPPWPPLPRNVAPQSPWPPSPSPVPSPAR